MVRPGPFGALLCAAWLACLPALGLADAGAAPEPVSPAAETEALPRLPDRPAVPPKEPNVGWQDFTAVTLVSMPFTAFWALLGALAVGGISQGRFPPEIDTPMLVGAAAVAGGSSVAIGLVSLQWGGPKPSPSPTPAPETP